MPAGFLAVQTTLLAAVVCLEMVPSAGAVLGPSAVVVRVGCRVAGHAVVGTVVLAVVLPVEAVPAPVPRVVAEVPAEVDSVTGVEAVLGAPF